MRRFPHSLNVAPAGSDLRIQIQTDPRYADFMDRAERGDVLGISMPMAAERVDTERLIEADLSLRELVPREFLERLEG